MDKRKRKTELLNLVWKDNFSDGENSLIKRSETAIRTAATQNNLDKSDYIHFLPWAKWKPKTVGAEAPMGAAQPMMLQQNQSPPVAFQERHELSTNLEAEESMVEQEPYQLSSGGGHLRFWSRIFLCHCRSCAIRQSGLIDEGLWGQYWSLSTFLFTSINAYPTEAGFIFSRGFRWQRRFLLHTESFISTEAYPTDACVFAVAWEDSTGFAFGFFVESRSLSSIVECSGDDDCCQIPNNRLKTNSS